MSGNDNQNLIDLSESAINLLKKPPKLVRKIVEPKSRVIVDTKIRGLYN